MVATNTFHSYFGRTYCGDLRNVATKWYFSVALIFSTTRTTMFFGNHFELPQKPYILWQLCMSLQKVVTKNHVSCSIADTIKYASQTNFLNLNQLKSPLDIVSKFRYELFSMFCFYDLAVLAKRSIRCCSPSLFLFPLC